ncbi:hypothetical protein [Paenarthrobacter sp. NPDC057981]|uniref:hypothetical protein n=1 Tax=Paenarthrobacter sp. NPDC057981 TaxID=3346297 RepID=UPI0036DA8D36
MDEIGWLSWVGGIVIGAIITWFFSWKYGNRRRKLLFTWEAVQLMPDNGVANGGLEVSYEGTPVQDPYLVKVTIKNLGPSDISTRHFDSGQMLKVMFPAGYVSTMDTDVAATPTIRLGPDFLGIPPLLLKRGAAINLDVLVDGPTTPNLDSPIVDTDIVRADARAIAVGVVQQSTTLTVDSLGLPGISVRFGSRRR